MRLILQIQYFGTNLISNAKITTQNIAFKSSGDSFKVTFDDIFDKYPRPDNQPKWTG